MDDPHQPSKIQIMLASIGSVIGAWFAIMMLPLIFTYLFGEFAIPPKRGKLHTHKRKIKQHKSGRQEKISESRESMRLSIVKLGEVFVKERLYALPKKGSYPKNAFKISLANAGIIMVLSGIGLLFGTPTPDIRHDLRCYINSDFKQYSQSKRKVYLDHFDERHVRGYFFHEGKIRRQHTYGPFNEDVFKMQDYDA